MCLKLHYIFVTTDHKENYLLTLPLAEVLIFFGASWCIVCSSFQLHKHTSMWCNVAECVIFYVFLTILYSC